MNIISQTRTILISLGFIVPMVAVSKLMMVMLSLETQINLIPVLLSAIGMLPIYIMDRVKDPEEDQANDNKSQRREIVQRYKHYLTALSIVLIVTYFVINVVYLDWMEVVILHTHLFIFVVYSKTKPFILIDTLAVGIAWSTFILGIVVFYSQIGFSLSIFIAMLVMKMGETELSNIRDLDADKKSGNPTLPVVVGEKKTMIFVNTSFALSIALLSYYLPVKSLVIILMLSIVLIYIFVSDRFKNIERMMYWDRIIKLLIGLTCLIFLVFLV